MNVGAYVLIVLMVFLPYLQQYYNFTRLYLQMFLVLSILSVTGGAALLKKNAALQHGASRVACRYCLLTRSAER